MFTASPHTLKLLAALVWYSGFIVLFIKSSHLFMAAEQINPSQSLTWLAILSGLVLGSIKAKYLYIKICIKNLNRINVLQQPKIWNFYRIQFFIFLSLMIILGSFLSRLAPGNYTILITMAVIELSVATALLGSSHCFWKSNQKNSMNHSANKNIK